MMTARLYTEYKNYNDVIKLVELYFDGATFIKADGLWQENIEQSLIIEIVCDKNDVSMHKTQLLALNIKKLNNQQAILIQYLNCDSIML